MEILWKFCENFVEILWKFCGNLLKSCKFWWLNLVHSADIRCTSCTFLSASEEMNAFTKHNVEPGFVFSWLEFLICIFVSGITGLVLGLSLRWEIGVGVGGAIFLLQYVILGEQASSDT